MIKKIIEISQSKSYLSVRHGQLVIKRNGQQISSIPCEDIGVLLVDHKGVTYTHSVFTELLSNKAAVVLCGDNHHPTGMFLPIETNHLQTEKFRQQINTKEPVKKRLWKQLVQAKIKHQAKVVGKGTDTYDVLMALRKKVKSGDTGNVEALASRKFWPAFLQGIKFKRDSDGQPPNNLLNYGYMVVRAAVARAICSAGLLPTLGIHHCNRYNAFCLADDMIEPFRGFVDAKVRDLVETEGLVDELDQRIKGQLLEVLYDTVTIGGRDWPLMVGLHRTMASLARCFAGDQEQIDLPVI